MAQQQLATGGERGVGVVDQRVELLGLQEVADLGGDHEVRAGDVGRPVRGQHGTAHLGVRRAGQPGGGALDGGGGRLEADHAVRARGHGCGEHADGRARLHHGPVAGPGQGGEGERPLAGLVRRAEVAPRVLLGPVEPVEDGGGPVGVGVVGAGDAVGLERALVVGEHGGAQDRLVAGRGGEGPDLGGVRVEGGTAGGTVVVGERQPSVAAGGQVGRVGPVPEPDGEGVERQVALARDRADGPAHGLVVRVAVARVVGGEHGGAGVGVEGRGDGVAHGVLVLGHAGVGQGQGGPRQPVPRRRAGACGGGQAGGEGVEGVLHLVPAQPDQVLGRVRGRVRVGGLAGGGDQHVHACPAAQGGADQAGGGEGLVVRVRHGHEQQRLRVPDGQAQLRQLADAALGPGRLGRAVVGVGEAHHVQPPSVSPVRSAAPSRASSRCPWCWRR